MADNDAAGPKATLTGWIAAVVCALLVLVASLLMASLYYEHKNYSDGVEKALTDQFVDHAAILSYSRAWDIAVMKTSGMCFGFLLTFLGALYVLRTRDNAYALTVGGLNKENTLRTSSPGLVMITLGVALVATSILKEATIDYQAPTRVAPVGSGAVPTGVAEPQPVATAADLYQSSVRNSQLPHANTCRIVTDKSAYEAELARLKLAPGTNPLFPKVDWANGEKALIFAAATDGKTEYRFKQFSVLPHKAPTVFSFAMAGSSGFPVSEVIVVHLPRDYRAENGCSCQTESPQQYASIGGGRLASVSSALDADELAAPLPQGQVAVSGRELVFHNQPLQTTSAPQTITVTNKGPDSITMGAITLNYRTAFAILANTCPSSGHTLAAKASCAITVTFTPPSAGPKRGTLIVNDSDPGSPHLVGLTGTGTGN